MLARAEPASVIEANERALVRRTVGRRGVPCCRGLAALARIGALPQWAEVLCTNFLLGGQAWAAAEKAKLADLNWQIVVQKPP